MKTIKFFFFFALVFSTCANLRAQVTFGGLEPAKAGAVLDLNSTTKGGLVLSNVSLDNLYTIPYNGTDFPGLNASNYNTEKSKFAGAIVYNINPVWGAGAYVWNGENWSPVGEDCRALTSVSLTASDPFPKTGDPVTFTASGNAGGYCSGEITYTWSASGPNAPDLSPFTGSTVTTSFPSTNVYVVTVMAKNNYMSGFVTETLTVSDPAMLNYTYGFLGSTCLDVKKTNDWRQNTDIYNARVDAFPGNVFTKTYTFVHSDTYSNLSLSVLDPAGLVDNVTSLSSSGSGNASESFTVTFKSDIRERFTVNGADSSTVKLVANYQDVDGMDKIAYLEIRAKDGYCVCQAKTSLFTYLNFLCHNQGAEYDIISSAQFIDRSHHGDWYRFGAPTASMRNTEANDININWDVSYYQDDSYDWSVNPCPAGWRLPGNTDWSNLVSYYTNNNSETSFIPNPWTAYNSDQSVFNNVMKFGGLYLPAAGARGPASDDANQLQDRGNYGYYWSSSDFSGYPITSGGRCLQISKLSNASTTLGRFFGLSVRCVAAE
jgi:uncharacterized protein (TIGR02145 family)